MGGLGNAKWTAGMKQTIDGNLKPRSFEVQGPGIQMRNLNVRLLKQVMKWSIPVLFFLLSLSYNYIINHDNSTKGPTPKEPLYHIRDKN